MAGLLSDEERLVPNRVTEKAILQKCGMPQFCKMAFSIGLFSLIRSGGGAAGPQISTLFTHIVPLIPFREFPEAFAEGGGGAVAVVFFQCLCVGIGDGDVAGLHGDQFLMGFEVVVLRKDAGPEEFLLQDVYEVEEVFRMAAADVVYRIGRNGKSVFAVLSFRCSLHDPDHPFYDVIYVGEVPFAVAVIEDLDGLSFPEFIGKSEVGHIRTAGGAVDREEPEARGGDVVQFRIAVGQEFVGLLGGCIEGYGVVHLIVGAEGDLCIAAVDGGGGSIDQVLHAFGAVIIGMAAGFEDVVETDEIGLDVHVGIRNGVPHAGLGGEIHHDIRMPGAENGGNGLFIRNISPDEMVLRLPMGFAFVLQFLQTVLLQGYVVVVVHIVDADDADPLHRKEPLHQVRPDKPGRTGDENGFVF